LIPFPVSMNLVSGRVHVGILTTVNMEIGRCHPPVGLNLYVASGITKMGITELTVAVWPWLLTMLAFLVVVTYWPSMSLWLPNALLGRSLRRGGAGRGGVRPFRAPSRGARRCPAGAASAA